MNNKIPKTEIIYFLNSLRDYVVLRNYDIFGNLARGGDIDILVDDIINSEEKLLLHLGQPLIVSIRSYVRSYFYSWGKIDLLPKIDWHGAVIVQNIDIFSKRYRSELGIFVNYQIYEALICWFASLLWGGFVKKRYKELIIKTAKSYSDDFENVLKFSLGLKWAKILLNLAQEGNPEESVKYAKKLRGSIFLRSFRREPFGTIRNWFKFWYYEIQLRLKPPMPWIAILGPDGCGKSSLIEYFQNNIIKSLFEIKTFHWRPGVIRSNQGDSKPVTDPHAKLPRGMAVSIVKLLFLWTDWFLGYWGKIVHLRAKKNLVVFDRYYLDIIVDPKRYRFRGPKIISELVKRLIPKPNIIFLLDADPEILQSRKKEVPFAETERQRNEYLRLIKKLPNGIILDAAKPINEVATEMYNQIIKYFKKQH